jgi:O-antigen ligase
MNKLAIWIGLVVVAFLLAFLNTQITPTMALMVIAGIAIFVISFFNIEAVLYILIFSMLLGPEIVLSKFDDSALFGRGITFRLDDFLLLLIGFSWFARSAVYKELGLIKKTPLNIPILLYIFACLISTGWGMVMGRVKFLGGSLFVLKYIEYFIIYFMIANHLHTQKQAKRLVFCVLLTCFLVSLYGLYQIPSGQRVTAPFEGEIGEPNTFGGYLLFMMSLAAGLVLSLRQGEWYYKYKVMLVIVILTAFPTFIFTLSRSSYVAFIPMYFSLLIFSEKKRPLVIGLALSFLIGPFVLPDAMKKRIMHTFTQRESPEQVKLGGVRLDLSTSQRVMAWRDAFRDFIKKPVLGYGVTGYHFMDAQIPRTLLETGIIGLLSFLNLWYALFRVAYRRLKESRDHYSKGLALGFLCGFIALVVHAIGTNTFIIVRIMEPFWLLAGILIMFPYLEKEDTASSR